MTPKTTTSVRVSPDTLLAIDAAASASGVNRSQMVDRILGEWVRAQVVPIEQQGWYRAGALAAKARDAADEADDAWYHANVPDALQGITNAIHSLADAIDVLAGTAPDNAPG